MHKLKRNATRRFLTLLFGFTPFCVLAQGWAVPIAVSDGVTEAVITLGVRSGGSDAYDPTLDVLAPPAPPPGAFDARLRVNGEDYLTDIRSDQDALVIYDILYEPADGAGPIKLSWESAAFPVLGIFEIVDPTTGTEYGPLDMRLADSLDVSAAGDLLADGVRIRVRPKTGVGVSATDFPTAFRLLGNYPNPFSESTVITFDLADRAVVSVKVFDIQGRRLLETAEKTFETGPSHKIDIRPGHWTSTGPLAYRLTVWVDGRRYASSGILSYVK